MKKFYINACNIHSGGGKVLLENLLEGIGRDEFEVVLFVDKRCKDLKAIGEGTIVTKVEKNLRKRFLVDFKIKKLAKPDDIIVYFGNIPP